MNQYLIEFTNDANTDAMEGYEWYEVQQVGLGGKFLKEINERSSLIALTPEIFGANNRKNFREAKLKNFPY